MSTQMKEAKGQLIFRHTNARKGRNVSITPDNSAMKHLVYGRIILDEQHPSEKFSTGPLETGLICLSGECTVKAGGQTTKIDQYDSVYIPRDTEVEIATDGSVDLVECSAEVEKKYPLQIVRYADVEKDSSLKFKTGGPSTTRTVNITLGKNIEAGRILAGFTTSEPGHWTSWPPHEHAAILESGMLRQFRVWRSDLALSEFRITGKRPLCELELPRQYLDYRLNRPPRRRRSWGDVLPASDG